MPREMHANAGLTPGSRSALGSMRDDANAPTSKSPRRFIGAWNNDTLPAIHAPGKRNAIPH